VTGKRSKSLGANIDFKEKAMNPNVQTKKILSRIACGSLFSRTLAAVGALLLSILSAGTLAAQGNTVNITVDGLPGGLQVAVRKEVLSCATIPFRFVPQSGVLNLSEESFTTIEQGTQPGLPSLRLVVHARYTGTTVVTPSANCEPNVRPTSVALITMVSAEDNGSTTSRQKGVVPVISATAPTNVNITLEAKTVRINENFQTLQPNAPIARGILHRWAVNYFDSYGSASVITPSLDFTQPGISPFGLSTNFSQAKMWITTDNRVCLRVAGVAQCAQTGNITVGNVTVDADDTLESVGPNASPDSGKSVVWRFSLGTTFPLETFNVIASAEDQDLDAYIVNGEPEVLNLLPWKSLKLPIVVTN
jgi:hypothetical protein